MKTVDLVIPTYKPDKRFLKLMRMLKKQSYPVKRIIIVNTEEKYYNHLVYGTNFMEDFKNAEVYHHSKREFDHGRTRNSGLKRSDADYAVLMTQDAVPADEYLIEELVSALEQPETAAAYARQLPDQDCGLIEQFTRSFNYPEEPSLKSLKDLPVLGIKTYFCSNVCAIYDLKIFKELGGFINHAIFNEDMIYAAGAVKAGYQIAYASKARVYHSHNYTNRQQFSRNFDIGVSQADFPEIFQEVPSESEGLKMVKRTAAFLKNHKKGKLIPSLYLKSACKLIGYKLGLHYKMLPAGLVAVCSMNKDYWRQDNIKKASAGIDAARGYGRAETEMDKSIKK